LLSAPFILCAIWLLWFFPIGYISLSEKDAKTGDNEGIFYTILTFTRKTWVLQKKNEIKLSHIILVDLFDTFKVLLIVWESRVGT
jgi:hypothetical protein